MEFNWLDWVIMGIILVSALISLTRGFVKESLSLLIWVLAVVIALVFQQAVSHYLEPHIASPSLRKISAIALLFVSTLLIGALCTFIVSKLVIITGLSGLDRLLGMVFGLLRGVVLVVIVMMMARSLLPVQQEIWWKTSQLVPYFEPLESWVITVTDELRHIIQPLFSQLVEQAGKEIIQSK